MLNLPEQVSKMTPGIWITLAVFALGSGGAFFAGRSSAKRQLEDQAAATNAALESTKSIANSMTEAVTNNSKAMSQLAEATTKPLTIDAETKKSLASNIPAGCLDPKASLSAACLAASCWQFQQGDGGRSDASKCSALIDDARIQSWIEICGKLPDGKPDWSCVAQAAKAKTNLD